MMGCNYYLVSRKPTIARPLHIGKSSGGWKFLFHEVKQGMCEYDYNLELHTYEQWINFLKNSKDKYVILNEYDEEVSVRQFKHLISKKQEEDNPKNFENCKNVNDYRFTDKDFS